MTDVTKPVGAHSSQHCRAERGEDTRFSISPVAENVKVPLGCSGKLMRLGQRHLVAVA